MAFASIQEARRRFQRRLTDPFRGVAESHVEQFLPPTATVSVKATAASASTANRPKRLHKTSSAKTSQQVTTLPPLTEKHDRSNDREQRGRRKLGPAGPRDMRRTKSDVKATDAPPLPVPSGKKSSWRGRLTSCGTMGVARVREKYRLGRVIGNGAFSCVRLAIDRDDGREWACKILRLPRAGEEPDAGESTMEEIINEVHVLQTLGNHSSLTSLREYFIEGDKVYVIIELVKGGELLYAVAERGSLTEDDTREIMLTVFKGIAHMHKLNVSHRDLKLENLLLVHPDCIQQIKIADFGLSKKMRNNAMKTVCGTPMYVSPEALNVIDSKSFDYGPECDVWAAGIIMFILLGGYPPFLDSRGNTEGCVSLFRQIQSGNYNFRDPVWYLVTEEAQDLIKKLLVVDPKQRLTASQALRHPWCQGKKFSDLAQNPKDDSAREMSVSHVGEMSSWKDREQLVHMA